MKYVIRIVDRKTKEIVQEEIRDTQIAADKAWCSALKNINQLKYKMIFLENYEDNS